MRHFYIVIGCVLLMGCQEAVMPDTDVREHDTDVQDIIVENDAVREAREEMIKQKIANLRKPHLVDIDEHPDEDGSEDEATATIRTLSQEQVPTELSIRHFAKMKLKGDNFQLEDVLEENEFYTRHAIGYTSNGLYISGILYVPKGDGPFPLIVLNHGYIRPSVYSRGRGLKREQDFLARSGFAVLHSDYRGHAASDTSPDDRHVYDASLEYSIDVINAIHAIRKANPENINTARIGMLGHSMGGGIAMNIATAYPDIVDAIILYAPVHTKAWENFLRWEDNRDENDRTRDTMGSYTENRTQWNLLSSWNYLFNIQSPVLIFHGTRDADVPVEWSRELQEELIRLRKDSALIELQNEKHEFIPQWEKFMNDSVAFFRENI